jgi:zinc transport system substrate-binding protein
MKKILLIMTLCLFCLTGCELDNSTFNAKSIKTSVYPIEYITNYLYGTVANVSSIYPDGADYYKYEVTDKLIADYSTSDLLIYDGASDEKKIAVKFINNNPEIQIIDAMQGMNYKYGLEELWLDPSNFLMISSNIKNGLLKLSTNKYTNEKIETNYSDLKVAVSKLDVEFNTLTNDASYTTIVTSSDVFQYLTKYDINVIVLNENNITLNKDYSEVKTMAANGEIKYIYTLKGEEITEQLKSFIKDNNLTKIEIDSLAVISETDRSNKEDYISLMTTTINQLKKELNK